MLLRLERSVIKAVVFSCIIIVASLFFSGCDNMPNIFKGKDSKESVPQKPVGSVIRLKLNSTKDSPQILADKIVAAGIKSNIIFTKVDDVSSADVCILNFEQKGPEKFEPVNIIVSKEWYIVSSDPN